MRCPTCGHNCDCLLQPQIGTITIFKVDRLGLEGFSQAKIDIQVGTSSIVYDRFVNDVFFLLIQLQRVYQKLLWNMDSMRENNILSVGNCIRFPN